MFADLHEVFIADRVGSRRVVLDALAVRPGAIVQQDGAAAEAVS